MATALSYVAPAHDPWPSPVGDAPRWYRNIGDNIVAAALLPYYAEPSLRVGLSNVQLSYCRGYDPKISLALVNGSILVPIAHAGSNSFSCSVFSRRKPTVQQTDTRARRHSSYAGLDSTIRSASLIQR